jgi:tetratricopeptide (TPR) repeat protein
MNFRIISILIFYFLFYIISNSSFAQFVSPGIIKVDSIGYLEVTGYVEKNRKPLENVGIIVYENNKNVANLRTFSDGKFSLKLEFKKYFKIEISKEDLVTKKFEFNTHLPDNVDNQQIYTFDFNIVLFPKYSYIDMRILDKPLAIIKYQFKYNDFFYDYIYAKSINDKVIDLQKKVELLMKEYSKSVDDGRRLFESEEYKESLIKYQRAHDIFPDEPYPNEQIAIINNILNKEKSKKVTYNQLIAKTEEGVKNNEYDNAKNAYLEASMLVPSEKYPKDKINEIDKIFADAKLKQELYNKDIADADGNFDNRHYEKALELYANALSSKPDEIYPEEQISKINDIVEQKSKQDNLYLDLIAKADKLFDSKQYLKAKVAYRNSLNIKPDEKYPGEKISGIEKILTEENNKLENYWKLIEDADESLEIQDYKKAQSLYSKAYILQPDENYCKDKLSELNRIIENGQTRENSYRKMIVSADIVMSSKDFERAILLYHKASEMKPEEKYPKNKIKEIEDYFRQLNDNKSFYLSAISEADDLFNLYQYKEAEEIYKKAHYINPVEKYPVSRIKEINKILIALEYEKSIGEINNELIEKLIEKKFSFNPFTELHTTDKIIILAKNLSDKPYKVLIFYGKEYQRSGGFELNIEKQDKLEKYIIPVGTQENWMKQRNNWISIQPIGGNIEINNIQIIQCK